MVRLVPTLCAVLAWFLHGLWPMGLVAWTHVWYLLTFLWIHALWLQA